MAFETIRGESGVDFIGTDGADALFSLNESGIKIVDAKEGNDNVDLFDESGVVGTAEVKLGEGADTFTMGVNSTITNRLSNSTVNGGPGNDDITTEGAVSTKIRGNENDDDFFLRSNYTSVTVNGNSGQDSFTLDDNITLSNSKILGGSGNDGQMDFSDADILAVDSVIQGGKGLDTITIGDVTALSSGFRVSGGADNDTINVSNTGADGVAYNGAGGEDQITFAATNTANATTKGGDDADRITIGGTGDIDAKGEAGDDVFQLDGSVTGNNTITGGAGSDSYSDLGTGESTFVFNSVSESAAATSGTAVTFDVFVTGVDNTTFSDVIDLSSGGTGEALVGNRLNADEVTTIITEATNGIPATTTQDAIPAGDALVNTPVRYTTELQDEIANVGNSDADVATATAMLATFDAITLDQSNAETFAELKADLDGNLTASDSNVDGTNTGRISLQMVEVVGADDGTINGYYAILNNTNTILDSGDMMFEMSTTTDDVDGVGGDAWAAYNELGEIAAAIEAGF